MASFADGFRGRKVFLTGHTGFKGAWLAQWLLDLGAEVAGFSIDIPTKPALFEALGLGSKIRQPFADLANAPAVSQAIQEFSPDYVFHLAAQPLVRRSYDQPVLTFRTNVLGTAHVLEALRGLKRLKAAVLVTTDKVYEPVDAHHPFRESDRLGGHDPYSASKAAAEIVIQSYFRSFYAQRSADVGIASARAGNVIGGGDWSEDRLIPDAVRAWEGKRPLVIRSPEAVRPWQHVLEPLSGYLSLALHLAENPQRFSGESYNFGPPDEKGGSVREVTDALKRRWKGFDVKIDASQTGEKKETKLLRLNWDKAAKDLRWKPRLPLAEALDWTAAWHEEFHASPAKATELTRRQIADYTERMR